jgi:protein involved in polysaccharide export with SLBB domain
MVFRFLLYLSCFCCAWPSFADSPPLQISVGDSLAIVVYNEADLSLKVRVDNSGIVNFPLIGQLQVLKLTPKQLAKDLEERYDDGYLVAPSVTVMIERYRPFYIHGEVKSPGVYEFDQSLTVEQAIAIAGGLSERASSSSWFIARPTEKVPLPVNKQSPVLPGDIITINSSFF